MFTKKRFFNLKFVSVTFLLAIFIVGGLFVKTTSLEAAGTVRYINATYSLSEVISTTNSNGEVTTKVLIGCAPGSKDIYDINTGLPCVHFTKSVLVGCAPFSGHLYDINTGKRCTNIPAPVLVGCQALSGDIYDINTGKRCTNISATVLTGCKALSGDIYDTTTGKRCTNDTGVKSIVVTVPTKVNIIAKVEPVTKKIVDTPTEELVAQAMEINQINNEPIETVSKDDDISGREKIKGSLMASVARVGSIFDGPMSFWTILLLIIILIAGGYGIYSFQKKEDGSDLKPIANPVTPKTNNPTAQTVTPSQPYVKTETPHTNPQINLIQTTTIKTPETNTTNPIASK